MPTIIDHQHVLERMTQLGMRSVYYNSGAFAHARGADVTIVGWLGPDDPTIRPDLDAAFVHVGEPCELLLAQRFTDVWPAVVGGAAWVLPKSHWSFELDHGNGAWLPSALAQAGVDPARLLSLTSAAAIEFTPAEAGALRTLLVRLLSELKSSDFAILFPDHPHLVTVHHHKQLWWQTTDAHLSGQLTRR